MSNVSANITTVRKVVTATINPNTKAITAEVTRVVKVVSATVSQVGKKGDKGDSGNTATFTAGANIGSQQLVMTLGGKVVAYDPLDEDNAYKCVGFTVTSVVTDAPVVVMNSGILNNPGWGLTQDAVYYAAASGGITATAPDTGISQAVGVALDSNNLFVEMDEPIIMD